MAKEKREWKKKRQADVLEEVTRHYIFCEGEKTEPFYFKGFKKQIEKHPAHINKIAIEIFPCAMETMRVLGEAEKYVAKNNIKDGHIWCVYDKDDFPADRFNQVGLRTKQLSANNPNLEYHAAWSNQCIEIWFILHFNEYVSDNSRSDYVKHLDERFQKNGWGKYQKNMEDVFELLTQHGNPKLAIRYAKKQLKAFNAETSEAKIAPATKVYALVEQLAKHLPPETRAKYL